MSSTLDNETWQKEIQRLHVASADDSLHWQQQREEDQKHGNDPDALVRMGKVYLAVNASEGRWLYMLARGSGAKYIVEFGASYGISTLYLGAAARDNNGKMITSEVHPEKCQSTRKSIEDAGLSDSVNLLEGDGRETLKELASGIDFVFLDGWKSHYLTILEILKPKLSSSAMVVADNIDHEAASKYAEAMSSDPHWLTERLNKMAVSVYLK